MSINVYVTSAECPLSMVFIRWVSEGEAIIKSTCDIVFVFSVTFEEFYLNNDVMPYYNIIKI